MTIDPALLASVIRDPEDKLAWGVLADWLDEHDQPIRAQAIRMELSGEFGRTSGSDPFSDFCRAHIDQLCQLPVPWEAPLEVTWAYGFPYWCSIGPRPEMDLLNWLRHEPILIQLILRDMRLTVPILEQLQNLLSLERLWIFDCELDFPHEMLARLPQLLSLTVIHKSSDYPMGDIENARLAAFSQWPEADQVARARRWADARGRFSIGSNPDSVKLHLSTHAGVPIKDRELIYLELLSDLTELEVYFDFLPDRLVHSLQRMHHLRVLRLSTVRQMNFKSIASLNELTTLELIFNDLWNIDFSGLERMISLESISFHSFHESEELIERIVQLPRLRVLRLSDPEGPAWSPGAYARLAELPDLRELALDDASWLTTEHFAQLPLLLTLETLDLSDTSLDDDGIAWIARIPKLKSVNIRDTNVTHAGVRELARLRPDISIDTNEISEGTP